MEGLEAPEGAEEVAEEGEVVAVAGPEEEVTAEEDGEAKEGALKKAAEAGRRGGEPWGDCQRHGDDVSHRVSRQVVCL